jgi:hypothetical protein
MTVRKIFSSNEALHRARPLADISVPTTPPTTIQPGVPVLLQGRPAISLTASGNGSVTQASPVPGISSITYGNGGVGNDSGEATFAFNGTFGLPVVGALTTTKSEIEVFIIPASGLLTLTSSGNTHYGWTDYPKGYRKTAATAAVRIGL